MRITKDRRTDLSDLQLREPEKFPLTAATSLNLKNDLKNDKRPLRFTSPLYSPLTPGRLVTVHPENSNKTGGFFGLTRSQGQQMHQGIDIEASSEKGLQNGVLAAEDGVVSRVRYDKDGYGHYIDIDHRGGYKTRYAHLSEVQVKQGEKVIQGTLIADSGKTGNADSPKILSHLHFEIHKNGARLDPVPFLTTLPPDRKLFLMVEGLQSPVAKNLSTGGMVE